MNSKDKKFLGALTVSEWKQSIGWFQGARQEDQGVDQQKAENDAKVGFLSCWYYRPLREKYVCARVLCTSCVVCSCFACSGVVCAYARRIVLP